MTEPLYPPDSSPSGDSPANQPMVISDSGTAWAPMTYLPPDYTGLIWVRSNEDVWPAPVHAYNILLDRFTHFAPCEPPPTVSQAALEQLLESVLLEDHADEPPPTQELGKPRPHRLESGTQESLQAQIARLKELLARAYKHHGTTSLPLAIKNYGSRQKAAAAGAQLWFQDIPTVLGLPTRPIPPDLQDQQD